MNVFLVNFFATRACIPRIVKAANKTTASLTSVFGKVICSSAFLLVLVSDVLTLVLKRRFSCQAMSLRVATNRSEGSVFFSGMVACLVTFGIVTLICPVTKYVERFFEFKFVSKKGFVCRTTGTILCSLLLGDTAFFVTV